MEMYEKLVDETITEQNEQLNGIMFVFTFVTVVMLPPQFLVGLFGINVRVPW